MKRIYYIACNELYSLFYSPIAWLMMVLFLVLSSVDYLGLLYGFVASYERGGDSLYYVHNVTDLVVSKAYYGYFPRVIDNLYIFFPLITMGLISREIGSGTIRLLYSSPIRITELVLGKFLAMIFFILALMLLLLFNLVAFSFSDAHPDYWHMAGAMVALFLILCTYGAIGLFLSSLTAYQIAAAILTFALFAFLSQVGTLWQEVDMVRNITFYMNLRGRGQKLLEGLFNLRDIMYFVLLITAFLSFAFIRIYSGMESVSRLKKAGRYVLVVLIVALLGYTTSRPEVNAYVDLTRDQVHTITPPTQAMLAKLNEGSLEITAYGNLLRKDFEQVEPKQQNDNNDVVFERYIRFKPDIHIRYQYYYATDTGSDAYKLNPHMSLKAIAEKTAKTYSMDMDELLDSTAVSKQVDVAGEGFRNFFLLRYKGRSTIVRTFNDFFYFPNENEMAAAFNRLISTPPKVAFISDHIARGPFSYRKRDYRSFTCQLDERFSLINQGFDFDTISVERGEIPGGLEALVIADPRTPFSDAAMKKIYRYVEDGGNLMITGEPDRKEVLRPLLDTLGLSMEDGLLIQPSSKYSSDYIFTLMEDSAMHLSPQFNDRLKKYLRNYGDSMLRVAMSGAGVLRYHDKGGFRAAPLLSTDASASWNRLAPISNDSLQLKVKPLPTDEHGSFATAVLLSREVKGKHQHIYVCGDADHMTKTLLDDDWKPRRFNSEFAFWCFGKFTDGRFPANTFRPQTDDEMRIKTADMVYQEVLFYYVIPAFIAIAGAVLLLRRKRK